MHRYCHLIFLVVFASFFTCKDVETEAINDTKSILNPDSISVDDTEEHYGNVGRAIWQKPGLVIEKLGNISNKVVADIGAGTGYFSFRLVPRAKKVIAIEIEQTLLNYIDSAKVELPLETRNRLETRLANVDNPNLTKEEVDVILIINTIAYINNLPAYLATLKQGLKKDGIIMVIDYKMKNLPINAPPKTERIYHDKLEDLFIDAGYKILQSDDISLDYQYIIKVQKI